MIAIINKRIHFSDIRVSSQHDITRVNLYYLAKSKEKSLSFFFKSENRKWILVTFSYLSGQRQM